MKLSPLLLTLLLFLAYPISAEKNEVPFFEREQKRREHFFSHLPLLLNKLDQISDLQDAFSKMTPYAIPLDGTNRFGNIHSHYADQFYRLLVKTISPTSEFTIKVYEEGKVLHEEKVSLPLKGSKAWDAYLIEEGMVSIPETVLKAKYGLNLRVKVVSNEGFIVAVKGHSSYQFSICLDEEPLYTFNLSEPPPWQLEVLRKPVLPAAQQPLKKPSIITCEPPSEYPRFEAGSELTSHSILDQFVKELKNDPLAIAQYVQNEIDLVDPYLTKNENGQFERYSMTNTLAESQASRTALVGHTTMWALSVDPADSTYQKLRYGTTTTLEVASLAAGAYGVYTGLGGPGISTLGPKLHKSVNKVINVLPLSRQNTSAATRSGSFSGRKGWELENASYQRARNVDTEINGRMYVGHAIDQMQNRGIYPSVVENTIKVGKVSPDTIIGRQRHHDPKNNITVILEQKTGEVVTMFYGER